MDEKIKMNKSKLNQQLSTKIKKTRNIATKKIRNPGIDLLRILGMMAIVVFHVTINGNLYGKYSKYNKSLKLIEIITQWHISNIWSDFRNCRNKNS